MRDAPIRKRGGDVARESRAREHGSATVADSDGTGSGTGGGGGSSDRTFTQAEVDRLIADRLGRERGKYSDYDDLKRRAAEGDRTKSDVDKLTDSVRALTERAEQAEQATLKREAADKYELPKSFAKRLSGKTSEDLDREAREMQEELKSMGVKFGADKGKGDGAADGGDGGKGDGGGQGSTGGDGASGAGQGNGGAGASGGDGSGNGGGARGGRPKENLKSGANQSGGADDGDDPVKAADSILASRF